MRRQPEEMVAAAAAGSSKPGADDDGRARPTRCGRSSCDTERDVMARRVCLSSLLLLPKTSRSQPRDRADAATVDPGPDAP
jgi:hypothetical protein